jgi:predicted enzyme related to lactoylglutathione lyase
LYIQVLDLKASLAKAKECGGEVVTQPFDVPQGDGLLTIAGITDPEGNRLVLAQQ